MLAHPSIFLSIYHSQLPTLYAPQSSTSHGIKCPSYQIIGGPSCLCPVHTLPLSFFFPLFLIYFYYITHTTTTTAFLRFYVTFFPSPITFLHFSSPNQTSYKILISNNLFWRIIPHISHYFCLCKFISSLFQSQLLSTSFGSQIKYQTCGYSSTFFWYSATSSQNLYTFLF